MVLKTNSLPRKPINLPFMSTTGITIGPETSSDHAAIFHVHQAAFPSDLEAQLVNNLRKAGELVVSLVAIFEDQVVGHIALSPVTAPRMSRGLGLAPLAVLPAFQKRGIGAALVQQSIALCQTRDEGYIVVLGDPRYYSRFGFRPASEWGLSCVYGGGNAFQILELKPCSIQNGAGMVQYSGEFAIFQK